MTSLPPIPEQMFVEVHYHHPEMRGYGWQGFSKITERPAGILHESQGPGHVHPSLALKKGHMHVQVVHLAPSSKQTLLINDSQIST